MLPVPGEEFVVGEWIVGQEFVTKYLAAVADSLPVYEDLKAVPPLALAALALGALLEKLSLPPGTIHASQEVQCGRLVRQGERVSCKGRLGRPVVRGDWKFISVDFTLRDSNDETAASGKTTVLVPAAEAPDG